MIARPKCKKIFMGNLRVQGEGPFTLLQNSTQRASLHLAIHSTSFYYLSVILATILSTMSRQERQLLIEELTRLVARQRQKAMVEEEIRLADVSRLAPGLSETDIIQQLVSPPSKPTPNSQTPTSHNQVLQFLQHDGYVETARAFAEELHAEKSALRLDTPAQAGQSSADAEDDILGALRDDEDAHNRQRIRHAVLEGDMDRAMRHTDTCYPGLLRDNETVYFRLRCRKFIEMIRREAEANVASGNGVLKRGLPQQIQQGDGDEVMMEVGNGDADMAMAEDGNGGPPPASSASTTAPLWQEALAYGMELRAEFSADPRRETAKQLDEIFSLLAYPNPMRVKEVAHLVDGSGRVAVAEELNSAILSTFPLSPPPTFCLHSSEVFVCS